MSAGKIALITGGTRGIGIGIAHALAASGFNLAIVGRRNLTQVSSEISNLKSPATDVLYVQADVSLSADRARMLQEVENHFGRLDVLVNNAGIAPDKRADILEATEESFDKLMSVNLKGPYFLTQAAAKWMIRQHQADANFRGRIVIISSVSATVASVNRGDYCITKAGLAMAAQLWATRLGEFGIDVYEVRPGVIATDMTSAVKQKYDDLIAGGLTIEKRWGAPADVGRAVAALARGDLPYSTGQVLTIDGGLTIQRM
jgi:3-oxoacyl-[acyl-carrier protein] reductase